MPGADSQVLSNRLAGSYTSPSLAAMRGEMHAHLLAVVDGMEPLDREILALRHYEELSNQETAEELGITTAAASKRYVRALERLRANLAREGIPESL